MRERERERDEKGAEYTVERVWGTISPGGPSETSFQSRLRAVGLDPGSHRQHILAR